MKKAMTLVLLTLSLLSLGAATVYVGGEAGCNSNSIIAGKGYNGYEYSNMLGFSFSVPVVVEFNPYLAVQTGASLSLKGYDYTKYVVVGNEKDALFQFNCMNGFVELPLALRGSVSFGNSSWGAFCTLGGFVGYWMYGNRNGGGISVSGAYPVDEDLDLSYYNRIQAGVSASCGIDFEFSSFDAYLSLGYSLTLTDLNKSQKYASYPEHNSTFTLAAGLLWGVNK